MEIYLDLVFLLNFIFDFILLVSVNYILKRNISLRRIIFGSVVGMLTMFILFINITGLCLLLYKIIVSLLMLYITFGFRDFKYFWKNIVYFYMVSMLMGGAVSFLNNQFSYSNNGLIFKKHSLGSSYGIVLLISIFMFWKYMNSFKLLKNNYSNYYQCQIFFDESNFIKVNAFLDTGNKLNDPYTNKSIILVMKEKLKDIKIRSPIYVPYNSLNNHGLLTCFKAQKIIIDGKECDKFLVGISEENFFIDGIECILNNRIMEDLR